MASRSWREAFYEGGIWLLFVALLIPAVIVGYAIGHSEKQKTRTVTVSQAQAIPRRTQRIDRAPAFSADELADDPRENWITNAGRFSTSAARRSRRSTPS